MIGMSAPVCSSTRTPNSSGSDRRSASSTPAPNGRHCASCSSSTPPTAAPPAPPGAAGKPAGEAPRRPRRHLQHPRQPAMARSSFRWTPAGPEDVEIVDYHSKDQRGHRERHPDHGHPSTLARAGWRNTFKPLSVTQHRLAVAIGVPPRRINEEIVHGQAPHQRRHRPCDSPALPPAPPNDSGSTSRAAMTSNSNETVSRRPSTKSSRSSPPNRRRTTRILNRAPLQGAVAAR